MRLAIFGGTGATGQLLVQRALALGHELTVFARRPDKFTAHPRLRALAGELSDEERIERAVCDAHAVLSLLGPVSVSRGLTPIADGTRQILRAMCRYGVRRFVAVGTPSMPDDHDVCDWRFRMLVGVVRRAAAGA
ncbi:MAG TPA: NAD(P)H-binding protein, partial [Polyangiaceae bacterium]|nr:NAD(P)H-binding protein [Polyangiaceae bacterium]